MKLFKAVLRFTESNGKPSVIFAVPDTEYTLMVQAGSKNNLKTTVTPASWGDVVEGQDMPDELEMLMATSMMLMQPLGHYLACPDHRTLCRVDMGQCFERMERAKVCYPYLAEITLLSHAMEVVTGMPAKTMITMGLVQTEAELKPNEAEQKLYAEFQNGGDVLGDAEVIGGVKLGYTAVEPPLAADECKEFADYIERRKVEMLFESSSNQQPATVH